MKRPVKKAPAKRKGYAEGGQVGDGRFVRVAPGDVKPGGTYQQFGQDMYLDTKPKRSPTSGESDLGMPDTPRNPTRFPAADTRDLGMPDTPGKAKGGKVRKVIRKRK
jgi:hypothetical protein